MEITENPGTSGSSPCQGRLMWLQAPDSFAAPNEVRGWPRRTGWGDTWLTTYRGEELRPSWEEGVAALQQMAAANVELRHELIDQVIDRHSAERLKRITGRDYVLRDYGYKIGYVNARDSALISALVPMGHWRFVEALRLPMALAIQSPAL